MIQAGQHEHKFQHLYKGAYPDGSVIATKLCHDCGMVELEVCYTNGNNNITYLNQPQVQEMAYALLKGCNRFAHVLEHQIIEMGAIPKKEGV